MASKLLHTLLVCVGFNLLLCSHPVAAQDAHTTSQEAVRLLDSASQADVVAATDKLKAIVAPEHTVPAPPTALTALAMFQIKQKDYEAAAKTLKRLTAQFKPAELQARRGTISRMSLLVALARDDAAMADAAYKDLVRMVTAEQGDPADFKLNAILIGTSVGMLGVERAKSPVGARVLKIGNDQMLTSKLRGVGVNYQTALVNSQERTEALVANFLRIEKEGIDPVAAELAQRQETLKQRASELQEQKELTGEVIRNTREQVDQNTQDIRQLARDINGINLKLRQPTPGHPGPKRTPPPPLPSLYSIPVDEYETQNDYDYIVQNGQSVRVPVTRQVRRPQYEIDRDRNRILDRLREERNQAMAQYQAYDAQYTARLTSWINEDTRRRQELNDEKAELEVKRSDLVAANKAISDDKKDSTKELRSKRTETEQEEFDVEMLTIAVEAYRTGKAQTAFRPPHYESLNWTQEKLLLQKP